MNAKSKKSDNTSLFSSLASSCSMTTQELTKWSLGFFLVAQFLFLLFIQFPTKQSFDEFHYVPSAKQFLELRENQNWEHPPLAKELMAIGIGLFGDRPIGWRFMSTLFGSLTLVGMFFWALALFRDSKIAIWTTFLTLVNQLLYVQARIGMLDTFMVAFLVWGLAAFTFLFSSKFSFSALHRRRISVFMGACFGFATACKWFAVVPWVFCIGLLALVLLFDSWGLQFSKNVAGSNEDFHEEMYSPGLFSDFSFRQLIWAFVAVPVLAYFVTFIPFFFVEHSPPYGFLDILEMQPKMFDGQLRVVNSHPYMSDWKSWPWMTRPIWYAFDKELDPQYVRGVILLGNPILMWGGLLAMLGTAISWLKTRSRDSFLILSFYLVFVFCWAVIPRKVAFYYYYYPAGMILTFAFGHLAQRYEHKISKGQAIRWAIAGSCLGLFIYFFPVLSGIKIQSETFRRWMWLQSWI
ncbi:MAG: phospholipid carrier-dependent glycosyltransferase [Bdellovibrionales bacterium]|nr:phospholipid carrier-dependent glycosyltransferase [Bdellovibrionales bacterium]